MRKSPKTFQARSFSSRLTSGITSRKGKGEELEKSWKMETDLINKKNDTNFEIAQK